MTRRLSIVILGLSITSSWGNGHATTYRALVRGLAAAGHRVLFLERDVPWYAQHRDLPDPDFCRVELYTAVADLRTRWANALREADAVIVGSYVPDGVDVAQTVLATARGITAFYDIDTPVTLAKLADGDEEYLSRAIIPSFDLYLSFTGGPTLRRLESEFGAQRAEALHCAVDADRYRPTGEEIRWDLGYLGTYSDDRQPALERLLLEPARRLPHLKFVVAGPQYPGTIDWPNNVERIPHIPPEEHASFYSRQRLTLNITRAAMVAAGWSPSVRLFEAAACGVPILSDPWPGLETLFPEASAILVGRDTADTIDALTRLGSERLKEIGATARAIVLDGHTGRARAEQLVNLLSSVGKLGEVVPAAAI